MSDMYILNRLGEPEPCPDVLAWGRWYNSANADASRVVARTELPGFLVSTVFLGLDHRHYGEGLPILWETMVFADGSPMDQEQQRYTSKADALAGHAAMVAKLGAN